LQKTLQAFEGNDSKSEEQLTNNNKDETTDDQDRDIQSGTVTVEKNSPANNLEQWRSAHELESIVIFDLCALSEIATSKSAILRVRVLPLFVACEHRCTSCWKQGKSPSVFAGYPVSSKLEILIPVNLVTVQFFCDNFKQFYRCNFENKG